MKGVQDHVVEHVKKLIEEGIKPKNIKGIISEKYQFDLTSDHVFRIGKSVKKEIPKEPGAPQKQKPKKEQGDAPPPESVHEIITQIKALIDKLGDFYIKPLKAIRLQLIEKCDELQRMENEG